MRKQGNNRIYLDYAGSTPVDYRVVKAMQPYWNEIFANPSANHKEARKAREAVENARLTISNALHCKENEVFFTSGGTESNNIAIFGVVDGTHFVTSSIEHPSVLNSFKELERRGASVDHVGVNSEGILDMEAFEKVLRKDTALVSVMLANNEIGTIQPIAKIARVMRQRCSDALLHTDASQAPVYLEIDVGSLDVDLLTIDGQKMYGPKGVGVLYKRSSILLGHFIFGGKQESGLRPGTENVPSIVGMAKAYEIAEVQRKEDVVKAEELSKYFISNVKKRIPGSAINGSKVKRLPNNINISFEDVDSDFLVTQLDSAGIACTSRSACFGSGGEGSYVVAAINQNRAGSSVRFSIGRDTTREDIDHVISVLQEKLL